MPALNMFEKAKSVPVAVKAVKGKDKEVIVLQGLEDVAVLDTLIKTLSALKDTLREPVTEQMREQFIGGAENFDGVEGLATASAQLRKRSVKSALTPDEVQLLIAAKVPVGEAETVPERYIINPAYADNSAMLKKVSDALSKVPGMANDFIQFQAGVKDKVVTDETFDAVMKDSKKAAQLIDVVGVLALAPKLDADVGLAFLVEKAKKLLGLADSKAAKKAKK